MAFQPRGIVLLSVTGILVMLSLAGLAMASLALQLRRGAAAELDRAQARLLARSGVAYACSRLIQNASCPNPADAENQPDDWTFRDEASTPLGRVLNPSFSQAEPYTETPPANGRYEPGADAYRDLNGNGRFDSWSGRLRGRSGMTGGTFVLRVSAEGGKLDVNAGLLDGGPGPGGAPNCRSIAWKDDPGSRLPFEPGVKNVRISDVLNGLGQALSGEFLPARSLPTGGTVNPGSALLRAGDRIVGNRIPGGYASLEQVRPRFQAGEWDRIRPYLTLRDDQSAPRRSRFYRIAGETPEPAPGMASPDEWLFYAAGFNTNYSPTRTPHWLRQVREKVPAVNLQIADRPVLQALFAGLLGQSRHPSGYAPVSALAQDAVGLGTADAGRVADFLVANRPFASHYDLFVRLDSAKAELFPADDSWTRNIKVNLVAANADEDPAVVPRFPNEVFSFVPLAIGFPSFAWCSYDLPRWDAWPSRDPRMERTGVWAHFPVPVPPAFPMGSGPLMAVDLAYGVGGDDLRKFGTLPLSLETPALFSAESLGRVEASPSRPTSSAFCSATLRLADFASARSQSDFENAEGAASGPGGVMRRGRPAVKDRMQTYPRFPLDSCIDLEGHPPEGDPSTGKPFPAAWRFPDDFGTIGLMAYTGYRATTDDGQFFYQPCWEAGQPLREKAYPRISPVSGSVFANIIEADSPPRAQEGQPSILSVYLDLATELLFPFLNNVSTSGGVRYPEAPAAPVCLPNALSFSWDPGKFPWFDAAGAFRGGALDVWGERLALSMELTPSSIGGLGFGIGDGHRNRSYAGSFAGTATTEMIRGDLKSTVYFFQNNTARNSLTVNEADSIGPYAAGAYHRLIYALDPGSGTMTGYVDGIHDPGLFDRIDGTAEDPSRRAAFFNGRQEAFGNGSGGPAAGGYDRGNGVRLYSSPLERAKVVPFSLPPFYWNADADPEAAPGIPEFLSPLHVLPAPAFLTDIGWDGFVPRAIRVATESWNQGHPSDRKIPLLVEIWAYPDAAGAEEPWKVPVLPEAWRQGGGRTGFTAAWKAVYPDRPAPKAAAFRYRVSMDTSGVEDFSNESPVFDSVTVGWHSARLSGYESD